MTRVLMTAFEPYEQWQENASWLALVDLTRWYDGTAELTTRRYPVDLGRMSELLRNDLQANFDLAIHLGQAPGSTHLALETVGLNLRGDGSPLIEEAPQAYRTTLPLDRCADALCEAGIPATVSHHAGTFLCNATMFLSHHYVQAFGLRTKSVFIHTPLAPMQAAIEKRPMASMSTPMVSAAIAMIIEQLRIA